MKLTSDHILRAAVCSVYKRLLILLLLCYCLPAANAQNCTGCTTTVSTASSATYTINAGEKLCVTSAGSITGTVTLNGGTICNEGTFNPSAFTYQSGTFNNFGIFKRSGDVVIVGAGVFTNYTSGTIIINGFFKAAHPSAGFVNRDGSTLFSAPVAGGSGSTGEIAINTTGISGYQYTLTDNTLTGPFATGGIKLYQAAKPAVGAYQTIILNVLAGNGNTALKLYFDINNALQISNVRVESNSVISNLSADYYKISANQNEIRFLADGILNKDIAANAVSINIKIKDGLILTPNAAQFNTFEILGVEALNSSLTIYDNQSATVFQTTAVSTVKWNGKIGGVVVPGLYKFTLTVEGQVFNGQFFVNTDN